jgi:hypothetical protein
MLGPVPAIIAGIEEGPIMVGRIMRSALLPAAALLFGLGAGAPAPAASIGTTENTQFLPVWLHPGMGLVRPEVPALLNMPPGWMTGDAMAVIAPGGDWPPGLRDRFVGALLDSGTAVLEVNPVRGAADPAAALRTDMAAALRTAKLALGAGLVVVIGRGADAAPALEAVTGSGAIAVGLGAGATALDLQGAPELSAYPERPGLLCDLLGAAQAAEEPDIAAICRAAVALLR